MGYKKGEKFEKLAFEIFKNLSKEKSYESVEHNVKLDGYDGPRQIDILLKGKVGPFTVLTIIECKDHNSKVNVIMVDGLHSKMLDVKAHKAVLVSRIGFTNGAIRKARRLGISLCTAHSTLSERWKFPILLPIVIIENSCEEYTPSMIFKAISTRADLKDFLKVNDVPITKIIADYWNSNEIKCEDGITNHVFKPNIDKPNWITIHDGRKMEISDFEVLLKLKKTYYFGYVNDLESGKYLEFHEKKQRHVMFDPNELSDYREKLTRYYKIDQIPNMKNSMIINVKLMHNPEVRYNIK